jgi:hypothetical protein
MTGPTQRSGCLARLVGMHLPMVDMRSAFLTDSVTNTLKVHICCSILSPHSMHVVTGTPAAGVFRSHKTHDDEADRTESDRLDVLARLELCYNPCHLLPCSVSRVETAESSMSQAQRREPHFSARNGEYRLPKNPSTRSPSSDESDRRCPACTLVDRNMSGIVLEENAAASGQKRSR